MPGLLGDVTVLDLTWGIGGPLGGMLLADNGADVIKVEPPGGDPFRFIPAYHVWNRGKRSIVLNLKEEAGRAQLLDLCARADILLESFQPGTAERLGIGYEALHASYPRLIYASISGYGQDSARRDQPGYEPLVAAWLGLTSEQQGYRPGPRFSAFPIASYGAAFLMLTGVLGALHARKTTGAGQRIDASMVDGVFSLATMNWKWTERPGHKVDMIENRPTLPRRHLMTMGLLACADGKYLQIHTGVPGRFAAALEVLGILDSITPAPPHLEKNAPLTDAERAHLLAEIPRLLKTLPRAHWLEKFQAADVACLPVDPPGVAFEDPQALHDGSIASLDDPELGAIRMLGPVLRCAAAPPRIGRAAPRIGEHTVELLREAARAAPPAALGPERPQHHALNHPLQGVRIVDFGSFYAGPAASKILGDLGADVIKIEPLQGDPFRSSPSPFHPGQRGKRSLAVDIKTPEGRTIAHQLVSRADIVTHNMRPGVAERLGLGYEALALLRPGLIYLYSPGFGSSGPRANLPVFAPLLSAMCGLQWQSSGRGNPPVQWWISNEDQVGGALGAIWLLMGLHHQRNTGQSLLLESSLFNSALFAASEVITRPDGESVFRFELDAGQTGYGPLCRLYRAADGWVMLVVMLDTEWKDLTRVAGLESLAADARFADRRARDANAGALAAALEAWFAARTADASSQALASCKVPAQIAQPSRTTSYFLDEENVRSGRVVEYFYPDLGRLREQGHAVRFSATPGLIRGPAPLLGEHTRDILCELGYSKEQAADLRARRAVGWKDEAA